VLVAEVFTFISYGASLFSADSNSRYIQGRPSLGITHQLIENMLGRLYVEVFTTRIYVQSMKLILDRFFMQAVFAILYKQLTLKLIYCGLNIFFPITWKLTEFNRIIEG
jgi:hypothetical protein